MFAGKGSCYFHDHVPTAKQTLLQFPTAAAVQNLAAVACTACGRYFPQTSAFCPFDGQSLAVTTGSTARLVAEPPVALPAKRDTPSSAELDFTFGDAVPAATAIWPKLVVVGLAVAASLALTLVLARHRSSPAAAAPIAATSPVVAASPVAPRDPQPNRSIAPVETRGMIAPLSSSSPSKASVSAAPLKPASSARVEARQKRALRTHSSPKRLGASEIEDPWAK